MKKSIIFFVLAVILAVVGFFSMDSSKETGKMAEAVYVEDGKILPENEGKLVIVPGTVEVVTPLVDELTGAKLPGIRALRTVEVYERVTVTENEKTQDVLDWKNTTVGGDNEFNKPVTSNLFAECCVGEFALGSDMLRPIGVTKLYNDIDEASVAAKGYDVVYYNGTNYVSRMPIIPDGGELYQYGWGQTAYYMDYEGDHRISYKIPEDNAPVYTFIGIQRGNKLEADKDLGAQAAFKGTLTTAELIETAESSAMTGAVIAWVFAALLAVLGVVSLKKKSA